MERAPYISRINVYYNPPLRKNLGSSIHHGSFDIWSMLKNT